MAILNRRILLPALTALFAAVALFGSPANAPAQEISPEIVYQSLNDGDVLPVPPFVVQFCFNRPLLVKDLHEGGDFAFSYKNAQKQGFGLRIVFQPDGYGFGIYPGPEPPLVPGIPTPPGSEWEFTWRVVDRETGGANEGTINFQVEEKATPLPIETPAGCGPTGTGGTVVTQDPAVTPRDTRTPVASGETAVPDETDDPSASAGPSGTPKPSDGPTEDDDESGPDVLLLALLTIGVIGLLGGLAAIGFLVRRRIGFDPHKPGPGGGSGHH